MIIQDNMSWFQSNYQNCSINLFIISQKCRKILILVSVCRPQWPPNLVEALGAMQCEKSIVPCLSFWAVARWERHCCPLLASTRAQTSPLHYCCRCGRCRSTAPWTSKKGRRHVMKDGSIKPIWQIFFRVWSRKLINPPFLSSWSIILATTCAQIHITIALLLSLRAMLQHPSLNF